MYIIIGQGAAGTTAANTLKNLDRTQEVKIITNEPDWYYNRIDLPDIVGGRYQPADAILQAAEVFNNRGIDCLMGETVMSLIPKDKSLSLASGKLLHYDKLLIATGSRPVVPPIEGASLPGIHCLWTMEQARNVVTAAADTKAAVVVGAGLIGLKTALALKKRGLKVTVVEKMSRLLPQQLDETGAAMIRAQVEAAGVEVLTGTEVKAFVGSGGAVKAVALADDKQVACGLVILAVGVRPNSTLAQTAGIEVQHGIVTDSLLATSDPDIYAAGDVAEVFDSIAGSHVLSATWPAAIEQGRVAARNMAGCQTVYEGYLAMNSVDIAGVPIISAGDIFGTEADEVFSSCQDGVYKRLVIRNNVVRGALFLGEIRQAGVLVNNIFRYTKMENAQPLSQTFSFADLLAI